VPTIRALAAIALVGLALVVVGGSLPVAIAGRRAVGAGHRARLPVGMSAAADDPEHAAGRVSVVASIGYVAFLAGPPLIGFLGEDVGTLRALTATGGLVALGLLVSGALRPLPAAEPAGPPGSGPEPAPGSAPVSAAR
jgi:MFS family permease